VNEAPVFLDANVFMYAAGAPHRFKQPCILILADVENGELQAAINTEIIQEILYRYSSIGQAERGVQLCREILLLPLILLPVIEADIRLAIDLFDLHRGTGLKARDAIHAATMQRASISRIITADQDFDLFGFLTRIDPGAYAPDS
jgi:predicted nucleic acid-binding protein